MNGAIRQPHPVLQHRRPAWDLLILAGVLWVARYWHSRSFGLYEDDFTIVPGAAQSSMAELFRFATDYFIHLGGHGRPLSNILYSLLVSLGLHVGGLWAGYGIGFLVTLLNIGLFYWLARRLAGPQFALLAGLAYCLYSADTTQVYLNHSLGLQPALTFFYLAAHAWLSRKTGLVYIAAIGALLTYETVYPLLFALPFLSETWDRRLARRLLINGGILTAILVLDAWARAAIGEGRITGLGVSNAIVTPLSHMLIGPLVSLGTYAYRPLQAMRGISLESALAMLLAFAAFFLMMQRFIFDVGEGTRAMLDSARDTGWSGWLASLSQQRVPVSIPDSLRRWLKIIAAGAILLVLAYPLTFTVRAYAISGRDTRVHFAAVVGASLVIGCVGHAVLSFAQMIGRKRLGAVVVAAFLSLMLGFGFVIQRDYVTAWQYQREFWTEILPLIPDAGEATVILVDPTGLRDTRQIAANYWNMPRVLESIYQYPTAWELPPRVYRLASDWRAHILTDDGRFQLNADSTIAPPSNYVTVDPRNAILLVWTGTNYARQTTPLQLDETLVTLRSVPATTAAVYPHGFLYPLLIGSRAANG